MNSISSTEPIKEVTATLAQGVSGSLGAITVVKLTNPNDLSIQVGIFASNLIGSFTQHTQVTVPPKSSSISVGFSTPDEFKPITISVMQSPIANEAKPIIFIVNKPVASCDEGEKEAPTTLENNPSKPILGAPSALPKEHNLVLPTPTNSRPNKRAYDQVEANSNQPAQVRRISDQMEENTDEPLEKFVLSKQTANRTQPGQPAPKRQRTEDAEAIAPVQNEQSDLQLRLILRDHTDKANIPWGQPITAGHEFGVHVYNPYSEEVTRVVCRVGRSDGTLLQTQGPDLADIQPRQIGHFFTFTPNTDDGPLELEYLASRFPLVPGNHLFHTRLYVNVVPNNSTQKPEAKTNTQKK